MLLTGEGATSVSGGGQQDDSAGHTTTQLSM